MDVWTRGSNGDIEHKRVISEPEIISSAEFEKITGDRAKLIESAFEKAFEE
jgi:hypothetical protein